MFRSLQDSREYDVGTDFMHYIGEQPEQMQEPEDYLFEEYDPEMEAESVMFPFLHSRESTTKPLVMV